jgi:serine/threonine-protein kinase HipA
MDNARCLYCYDRLPITEKDFHPWCSQLFFGNPTPPLLDLGRDQLQALAMELVNKSIAVTGVQAKLSVEIEKVPGDPKNARFTIVGLWGDYILKPPSDEFPHLPENEDCSMHLAQHFALPTAEHSLIRLQSGELAYITKRFDRRGKTKLALEDMCQLTETLTENKYRSSMEKIGKVIDRYAMYPGIDCRTFFETVLFGFLIGNADMHLKNFSLLTTIDGDIVLSPTYDQVNTRLVIPEDAEELALTLNGKKNKLTRKDFEVFGAALKVPPKSIASSFTKFGNNLPVAHTIIDQSFLPDEVKIRYHALIAGNAAKLGLLSS